ncbi:MAG: hypothetical protein ACD_49C00072G0002 [uncultured bacterium (gcode 4)]|uniref:Uncharacterized protein n=1 Tax=uncultured bacterium (gcode 4) TaxID=1234023 RepID=K2AD47_9BACT|nr:MAG: hypothetical protein ACD_49C00072G0002 [uncultured bacterium (gcode 4)]
MEKLESLKWEKPVFEPKEINVADYAKERQNEVDDLLNLTQHSENPE